MDDQSEAAQNDVMMKWLISSVWESDEAAGAWRGRAIWEKLGISGGHVMSSQCFTIRESSARGDSLSDDLARVTL
jgi:hypothetical protein